MSDVTPIDITLFLNEYWQKKPLVIRQAYPEFTNPLSPEELAGLALEDEVESRIVLETPNQAPYWQLRRGPFVESDFTKLPKTHWTLLVQGVDRLIPQVALLLNYFDWLPQWRIDDVMISYATTQGSVGPHYDNYDVFLYQASGRRKWKLTTQNCNKGNALPDVDLRIMAKFDVEEEYILEPGDMLYLPPHIGHHGISLSDDCMTYSFGYRSYQGQELWESFGDFLSENEAFSSLFVDPNWANLPATSEITPEAWVQARNLMRQALDDDQLMQSWFGCFATRLDPQSEQHMPLPLDEANRPTLKSFMKQLHRVNILERDATCRLAYIDQAGELHLYINGSIWDITDVSAGLVQYVANNRLLNRQDLLPYLTDENNQNFLYELWILQWLQLIDNTTSND